MRVKRGIGQQDCISAESGAAVDGHKNGIERICSFTISMADRPAERLQSVEENENRVILWGRVSDPSPDPINPLIEGEMLNDV